MTRIAQVIDYETTDDTSVETAEVVEMASVTVNIESREIIGQWTSLCSPRSAISPEARSIHHITDREIKDAPQARELWDQLYDGIEHEDYLVAHKAEFEQHFHPGNGQQWIDTYKVARIVWPDFPRHTNQALRYRLNLPVDEALAQPAHRALPDAYVTAHLFIELLKHKTPEEMATISRYPALLRVMNFGKYYGKGMTFEKCSSDDPKYLVWVRDTSKMGEDIRFSARYWLQKRCNSAHA